MTFMFERDTERDAYRLLHTQGLPAFEEAHPVFGTSLLNRWHEKGVARLSWPKDRPGLKVRTFKKYAEAGVR